MQNKAVIPLIGSPPFNHSKELSTACEIFIEEKNRVVLLLTRTPLTSVFVNDFADELFEFIRQEKLGEIVQLSSVFSHEQHFIQDNPFEYVANEYQQVDEKIKSNFKLSSAENNYLAGSGISSKLHEYATNNKIPSIILYKYVSEGDNSFDAAQLCSKVIEVCKMDSTIKIEAPISWKHLFGSNDVKIEIY
jgi:predicted ATP-grasp superfamily ATP-dependent carboligase